MSRFAIIPNMAPVMGKSWHADWERGGGGFVEEWERGRPNHRSWEGCFLPLYFWSFDFEVSHYYKMNTIKAKTKIILRVMMTGKPHRTRGNICLWKSFENDSWNGSRVSGISTGTMQDENTARKCTACAPHAQVGFRKSRAQHHSLIKKNTLNHTTCRNVVHRITATNSKRDGWRRDWAELWFMTILCIASDYLIWIYFTYCVFKVIFSCVECTTLMG